ncbi:cytochrome C oxidase Cbb3 [Corallincola luteus]|uniref:Cytochrome C oxidase Cbb3 n=2 Tax=Corallincola TaxID=1775176 RepID=A0A368NQ62_9GAMM|nr:MULTISPECIES: FixH family protein [Corallincola]RCU52682.1 cytochrome C oxidase Cbb3 [Corallincola holothuriorum]TCI03182.1 cytochrome C oxidase Cbb3 [Corallincola luteus]
MQTPWYKQFWPWFLIALPSAAVIASFSTLYIAANNAPNMVIDDYYKEGKAINLELAREKHAAELGIALKVLIAQSESGDVELRVSHQGTVPATLGALRIHLYHPTISDRDIHQLLTADANGDYRTSIDGSFDGKWRLSIESLTDDWRLQKTFTYPNETQIALIP